MNINFKNVHTSSDLVLSASIIIVGLILLFVNVGVGVLVTVAGLLSLLFYKKGYKREGLDVSLSKKDMELCKSCRPSLMDYLNGRDVTPQINEGNEGGCVRLLVYYNKQEGIAFAQLFDYCDYDYKEATEVIELRRPRVDRLIEKF